MKKKILFVEDNPATMDPPIVIVGRIEEDGPLDFLLTAYQVALRDLTDPTAEVEFFIELVDPGERGFD